MNGTVPGPKWHLTSSLFSEADRTILTACKQRGANWKTFRHVSAQLGNKTAQQVRGAGLLCPGVETLHKWLSKQSFCFLQVSLRFQDLMKLFHSAFPKSNSWSFEISQSALRCSDGATCSSWGSPAVFMHKAQPKSRLGSSGDLDHSGSSGLFCVLQEPGASSGEHLDDKRSHYLTKCCHDAVCPYL